jgi:Transposase
MEVFLDSPQDFGNLCLLSRTLEVLGVKRCYVHDPHRLIRQRYGKSRTRKTVRLEEALLAIALELGGRAGARLAEELGIVAACDTLLRRIKGASVPRVGKVRVLGVDDFAFKKGGTYGTTILVDLEEHRVVDLLPERSQESLVAWFGSHPAAGVEVATRERSNIYREGWPRALQRRRTWRTAGTCRTTSRSRWKGTCSRSSLYPKERPRPRRRPRTTTRRTSFPDRSCPTARETTIGR